MGFSAKRPSSFNSFRMSPTWLLRQNYIEEIIIYCLKYADYAIQYLNGRFKRGGLRVCKSFVSSHCTLSLLIPWQLFWIALPTVCISHAKYLHRLNVSESLWYAPDLLRPPPPSAKKQVGDVVPRFSVYKQMVTHSFRSCWKCGLVGEKMWVHFTVVPHKYAVSSKQENKHPGMCSREESLWWYL